MQLVRRGKIYGVVHQLYKNRPDDPVLCNKKGVLRGLWYGDRDYRNSDNYGKYEGGPKGWVKVTNIKSQKQFRLLITFKGIEI